MTGAELFYSVFYDELQEYENLSLCEIEEVEGVEDYEVEITDNEGWYNYYLASFKYNDKKYQFEYRSHTSDNVDDTLYDINSFKEFVDEKAEILQSIDEIIAMIDLIDIKQLEFVIERLEKLKNMI